jgi:hypothetical protein
VHVSERTYWLTQMQAAAWTFQSQTKEKSYVFLAFRCR